MCAPILVRDSMMAFPEKNAGTFTQLACENCRSITVYVLGLWQLGVDVVTVLAYREIEPVKNLRCPAQICESAASEAVNNDESATA